ncbi:MAG: hypothetical protein LBQ34_07780 [Alphaproteobacteria bacterium]|jgi:folate-binding protein YgfZ|nr:hypothetical protein [Alphaproteobacteria bacterium]
MNRTIIKIFGVEAETFLQNLISNDIKLLQENQGIYSLLLSPKGRYQFDFFVLKIADYFLIDIASISVQKFLDTLKYRKLITKVSFEILEGYQVYNTTKKIEHSAASFADPRLPILGFRTISQNPVETILLNYDELRFKNAIPESDDFTFDKSVPIEFGMDELGALCYSKGCYMGQEFTNSAKNKLAIRKRVISISADFNLAKGDIIINKDGIQVGEIVAASGNLGLALFSMQHANEDIFINEKSVKKYIPDWIKIYTTE